METILVTGGTGYIGSHTCLKLLENNYKVIVFDSLINSSEIVINKLKDLLRHRINNIDERIIFFQGDIRNKESIEKIFEKYSIKKNFIKAVIHFAGLKSVSESIQNPILYWDVNIKGSINLLEVMQKYGCKNIIFSSSATIYSQKNKIPYNENGRLFPINPYGNTKLTIENLLKDIYNSQPKEWRICNLRYFNPLGAHPSGVIGENPKGIPNNIFPIILNVASNKLSKIQIFGNDWNTNDGTCIRDYIHVMDLAEGHIASLNYLLINNPQINNFNLGTGLGTSVLSLINTFEETNNIPIPYEFIRRREGDLPFVVADIKKSKEILNWVPKFNIKDMCKDGWKWKSLNPEGYQ
tara:strand:- start:3351 stop:4406 length:1056 start_codon:yes stop_codon:yes gene_type:complete